MVKTLNISLPEDQAAWIKSRKIRSGYASTSDVIRDLIRRERQKEDERLEAEFDKLDKRDLGEGPPPIEHIVKTARKVRKRLMEEGARRS